MIIDDMIIVLRAIIGDLEDPPKYSDERLEIILVAASSLVNQQVKLSNTYIINQSTATIEPEPDESFANLTILMAACLLTRGELRKSSSQGILIKDIDSTIDTRRNASYENIISKNFCDMYIDAKKSYSMGGTTGLIGKAILSYVNDCYSGRYYAKYHDCGYLSRRL